MLKYNGKLDLTPQGDAESPFWPHVALILMAVGVIGAVIGSAAGVLWAAINLR